MTTPNGAANAQYTTLRFSSPYAFNWFRVESTGQDVISGSAFQPLLFWYDEGGPTALWEGIVIPDTGQSHLPIAQGLGGRGSGCQSPSDARQQVRPDLCPQRGGSKKEAMDI